MTSLPHDVMIAFRWLIHIINFKSVILHLTQKIIAQCFSFAFYGRKYVENDSFLCWKHVTHLINIVFLWWSAADWAGTAVTAFTCIGMFGASGAWGVTFFFTPEMFPTNLRWELVKTDFLNLGLLSQDN